MEKTADTIFSNYKYQVYPRRDGKRFSEHLIKDEKNLKDVLFVLIQFIFKVNAPGFTSSLQTSSFCILGKMRNSFSVGEKMKRNRQPENSSILNEGKLEQKLDT